MQAAKRMVQTMGKGLYSMSTVVQGEKLGQFLDTDMPSMDDLKVRYHCLFPQPNPRREPSLFRVSILVNSERPTGVLAGRVTLIELLHGENLVYRRPHYCSLLTILPAYCIK